MYKHEGASSKNNLVNFGIGRLLIITCRVYLFCECKRVIGFIMALDLWGFVYDGKVYKCYLCELWVLIKFYYNSYCW